MYFSFLRILLMVLVCHFFYRHRWECHRLQAQRIFYPCWNPQGTHGKCVLQLQTAPDQWQAFHHCPLCIRENDYSWQLPFLAGNGICRPSFTFWLSDWLSCWANEAMIVISTSPLASIVFMDSFQIDWDVLVLEGLMYCRQSRVLRANRLMDFVIIMSMFPAMHSSIIGWIHRAF